LAPQSGYTGEGFLAIDPEGNRYTFDWMVVYPAQTLKKQWNMPPILGMAPPPPATQVGGVVPRLPTFGFLEREEVWIYPSRIEDRFGNQVNFTWSGANLMQITASDGRAITLSYNSNGRVTSASNGSHTWTYGYDANNRYLFTAQRPDGSAWGYSMAGLPSLRPQIPENDSCDATLFGNLTQIARTATLTHPSGATGTFTFKPTQHGRANVFKQCTGLPGGQLSHALYPRYFASAALQSKTIAGPGLSAALTWTFNYGVANATWDFECGAGCITTKKVEVTGPDEFVRYTFSTKYAESEGKLLKRETGANTASILATQTMDYQWSAAGLAYPPRVGLSPMTRTDGMSGKQVPQRSNTIAQDGRNFSWSVASADFDGFARPLKTTRSSNLSGASQRVDKVEYHDDVSHWVLGQIKKRICYSTTATGTGCSNTTVAQTSYDPATALPLSRWSYGQLVQTLTWDTTSSVASGQRGTLKTVTDANYYTTTLSSWYRGVARFIRYPATVEAPSGATRSAIVSPRGEIT
jgi:YD repeat-containing protein